MPRLFSNKQILYVLGRTVLKVCRLHLHKTHAYAKQVNTLTTSSSLTDEPTEIPVHLLDKKELVVFNKIDLIEKDQIKKKLSTFKQEINKNAIAMSTLDKKTVSDIKSKLIYYVS